VASAGRLDLGLISPPATPSYVFVLPSHLLGNMDPFGFLLAMRRYTVTLTSRELCIRQEALGLHWTRRYPLEKVKDLKVRYNPRAGERSPPLGAHLRLQVRLPRNSIPVTASEGEEIRKAIERKMLHTS